MRIPRSIQLTPTEGSVHKFWQCHNKSYLLQSPQVKSLYLKCTEYALQYKPLSGKVKLSSFCIMNNHAHMHLDYKDSSENLSSFMRISHARFGFSYNKLFNRTGKVANERPKTPLIENPAHSMRVQFYIEANPIRAGLVKLEKLHLLKYLSYGFYAFGIKTKWTHLLTIPDWYLELGKTRRERQKKYRKLFRLYLGMKENSWEMTSFYIGSSSWKDKMNSQCRLILNLNSS